MPSASPVRQETSAAGTHERVLAVWHDVYFRELGWFDSFGPEVLNDGYQDRSTYVVAHDETGEPMGTVRMVTSLSEPLPVERFVDLSPWLEPTLPKVELTRLMVKASHRKQRSADFPFGVYRQLLRTAIRWSSLQGIQSIVLNVRARGEPDTILNSLVSLGFQETQVCIPDEFDTSFPACTLVFLDLRTFFKNAHESPSPEIRYIAALATPDPLSIHIGT